MVAGGEETGQEGKLGEGEWEIQAFSCGMTKSQG